MIQDIINLVESKMLENRIKASINYRIKDPFSILNKAKRHKVETEKLNDLVSIRVLVGNKRECYNALDIIYTLYEFNIIKFKDYIFSPKKNGYQSIHLLITCKHFFQEIEIQIRTKKMHQEVEASKAKFRQHKYIQEKELQKINPFIHEAYKALMHSNWAEKELIEYKDLIRKLLLSYQGVGMYV